MTLTQHNMFGFGEEEPPKANANTAAELKLIPWVNRWTQSPHFSRFSRSGKQLMAEFHNREFWVVGHMSEPLLELPEWVSPR